MYFFTRVLGNALFVAQARILSDAVFLHKDFE